LYRILVPKKISKQDSSTEIGTESVAETEKNIYLTIEELSNEMKLSLDITRTEKSVKDFADNIEKAVVGKLKPKLTKLGIKQSYQYLYPGTVLGGISQVGIDKLKGLVNRINSVVGSVNNPCPFVSYNDAIHQPSKKWQFFLIPADVDDEGNPIDDNNDQANSFWSTIAKQYVQNDYMNSITQNPDRVLLSMTIVGDIHPESMRTFDLYMDKLKHFASQWIDHEEKRYQTEQFYPLCLDKRFNETLMRQVYNRFFREDLNINIEDVYEMLELQLIKRLGDPSIVAREKWFIQMIDNPVDENIIENTPENDTLRRFLEQGLMKIDDFIQREINTNYILLFGNDVSSDPFSLVSKLSDINYKFFLEILRNYLAQKRLLYVSKSVLDKTYYADMERVFDIYCNRTDRRGEGRTRVMWMQLRERVKRSKENCF